MFMQFLLTEYARLADNFIVMLGAGHECFDQIVF